MLHHSNVGATLGFSTDKVGKLHGKDLNLLTPKKRFIDVVNNVPMDLQGTKFNLLNNLDNFIKRGMEFSKYSS